METQTQQEKLMLFCDSLPFTVVDALGAKDLDIQLTLSSIYTPKEFVLYETGNICEGVLKVLKGEDSPSNLVAFIEKDERIEEDNRPKIAEIAYEIQTKLFDLVLPILKQAGMPVKEGRVQEPPKKPEVLSPKLEEGVVSPYAPVPSPLGQTQTFREAPTTPPSAPLLRQEGKKETPPLDDKNVRALVRIASGTTYSEAQLKEAFEDLPQGLRQSISSVDTANAIQEIAKKYLLHVDQMGALASETGLVLLGLTHPAEFIGNLAKRLRVPEEKAKEIARDISTQILVKVREALRGLHEDAKPQSVASVERLAVSKEVTKQIPVAPSTSVSSSTPSSSSELNAKRLPAQAGYPPAGGLSASTNTPYSAGAKWNMGENILAKQAVQKEESLSRAEVLRGIENPAKFQVQSSKFTVQPKTANLQPKTLVGPTGWKPGQKNEVGSMNYELEKEGDLSKPQTSSFPSIPKAPTAQNTTPTVSEYGTPFVKGDNIVVPKPPMPPVPRPPVPPTPTLKIRPQSESATLPPPATAPKTGGEMDFLDQKLQARVSLPKEEKRYTTDPYREPLNS